MGGGGVWGVGGMADPAFPLLFWENSLPRSFVIAFPNPVACFKKIHTRLKLKRLTDAKAI